LFKSITKRRRAMKREEITKMRMKTLYSKILKKKRNLQEKTQ